MVYLRRIRDARASVIVTTSGNTTCVHRLPAFFFFWGATRACEYVCIICAPPAAFRACPLLLLLSAL